jgi:transcriptional regulator with XRE-family HTH domain
MADRIKVLRAKKGVTQEEFYNDTGIHLGRIESGDSNITVSTLDAICKYFDVTLEQFFKGL